MLKSSLTGGLSGIIAAALFLIITSGLLANNESKLIRDFYKTESLVSVSPHDLRLEMTSTEPELLIVDVRDAFSYKEEHILGAVNVPISLGPNEMLKRFQELQKEYPDREFVTYCYSGPCMASRATGKLLSENGIYSKHLNIGWNEWRYSPEDWNNASEWDTLNIQDYTASGEEPGEFQGELTAPSCSKGEISC